MTETHTQLALVFPPQRVFRDPPWYADQSARIEIGDVIEQSGDICALDAKTGRSTYMTMQRGVVTAIYEGVPGTYQEQIIRWRCLSAPPHYPYLHPSHGREYVSDRWDVRHTEMPPVRRWKYVRNDNRKWEYRELSDEERQCHDPECPCHREGDDA